MTIQLVLKAYRQAFLEGRGNIIVPNLIRLKSISIESIRGSKPNKTRIDEYRPDESRDLWTVM
jgi:hypothetical protein